MPVPAPSTEKRDPNGDRRASTAASGDQKHPKPLEKGCFPERLISTLPKRSVSPSTCTDHQSLTMLRQTRRTRFPPRPVGKERRTEISPTPARTRSRRTEHLPHPTRARTVLSRHRQLEGRHPSATYTRPVTPVNPNWYCSFFHAVRADPKHPGKLMVAEPPFHRQTQPKSTARRCFQRQPRLRTGFYPIRNKPRWDERFGSDTGAPHPPPEIKPEEKRAPSCTIWERLGLP